MTHPADDFGNSLTFGYQLAPDVPAVRIISVREFRKRRDSIMPLLDEALARSWQLEATRATLMAALGSGNAWPIIVEMGEWIIAAAVIERIETVNGDTLNIWLCGGGNIGVWLSSMLQVIEEFAQGIGIDAVMVCGREGWRRSLAQYGYKIEAVTVIKRLRE